jgi:hypothetical protein
MIMKTMAHITMWPCVQLNILLPTLREDAGTCGFFILEGRMRQIWE